MVACRDEGSKCRALIIRWMACYDCILEAVGSAHVVGGWFVIVVTQYLGSGMNCLAGHEFPLSVAKLFLVFCVV